MTVLPERVLKANIENLIHCDEVIFEYDTADFDSNVSQKTIKRLCIVKEGKKQVFDTAFPEARKTLIRRGIDIHHVTR